MKVANTKISINALFQALHNSARRNLILGACISNVTAKMAVLHKTVEKRRGVKCNQFFIPRAKIDLK